GNKGSTSPSSFPIHRGTFELVVNTIRRLKASGVAPLDMEQDILQTRSRNGDTTEVRRATDIHKIYTSYQERLTDRFMDTYGQVLLMNERYQGADATNDGRIRTDFASAFPGVNEVFVTGFFYLELPSVQLIARLAETSGTRWTIELEESKD